jgi:hypothetical protein
MVLSEWFPHWCCECRLLHTCVMSEEAVLCCTAASLGLFVQGTHSCTRTDSIKLLLCYLDWQSAGLVLW